LERLEGFKADHQWKRIKIYLKKKNYFTSQNDMDVNSGTGRSFFFIRGQS